MGSASLLLQRGSEASGTRSLAFRWSAFLNDLLGLAVMGFVVRSVLLAKGIEVGLRVGTASGVYVLHDDAMEERRLSEFGRLAVEQPTLTKLGDHSRMKIHVALYLRRDDAERLDHAIRAFCEAGDV